MLHLWRSSCGGGGDRRCSAAGRAQRWWWWCCRSRSRRGARQCTAPRSRVARSRAARRRRDGRGHGVCRGAEVGVGKRGGPSASGKADELSHPHLHDQSPDSDKAPGAGRIWKRGGGLGGRARTHARSLSPPAAPLTTARTRTRRRQRARKEAQAAAQAAQAAQAQAEGQGDDSSAAAAAAPAWR
jgi:hypothetical protein